MLRIEKGEQLLPIAAGDQVRVFNRIIVDKQHFASNEDVVTVLHADLNGMKARSEDGWEVYVKWGQLRARLDKPIR